jgi:hypothetical protein
VHLVGFNIEKPPVFITFEQSVPQHFVSRVEIVQSVRHKGRTSKSMCCVSVDEELPGEARELTREIVWSIAVCDCTVGTV